MVFHLDGCPILCFLGLPVCRFAGLPVCRFARRPVGPFARWPVSPSARSPVGPSARQPVRPSARLPHVAIRYWVFGIRSSVHPSTRRNVNHGSYHYTFSFELSALIFSVHPASSIQYPVSPFARLAGYPEIQDPRLRIQGKEINIRMPVSCVLHPASCIFDCSIQHQVSSIQYRASSPPEAGKHPCSYQSLVQHGLHHLHKPGDVGTMHIISADAVLFRSLQTRAVDSPHNDLKTFIHLFSGPG